jgi:hypothetical protein
MTAQVSVPPFTFISVDGRLLWREAGWLDQTLREDLKMNKPSQTRVAYYKPDFRDHILYLAFNISPARSPMMTQGAIVLPAVTRGMMEPSAMRRLSIP